MKLYSLDNLPLVDLYDAYQIARESNYATQNLYEIVDEFAQEISVSNANWFFPQLITSLSEVPLSKNANGLYSSKALLAEYRKSPQLTSLWLIAKYGKRSSFLKRQLDLPQFSSLVPLVMSGYRKYHSVPYSKWDPSEIHGITDISLSETMVLTDLPDVAPDALIEIRNIALTVKTGASAGKIKSPISSYSLSVPKGTSISNLPHLAKVMYLQTWCAHPTKRTSDMILVPNAWDTVPNALLTTSVLLDDDWAR